MKVKIEGDVLTAHPENDLDREVIKLTKEKIYSMVSRPVWKYGKMKLVSMRDKYWSCGHEQLIIILEDISVFVDTLKEKGIMAKDIDVLKSEVEEPSKIELTYIDQRVPTSGQSKYIEAALKKLRYVIIAKPGAGKTFMSGAIVNNTSTTTLILVLAKYIKMWEKNINEMFDSPKMVTVVGNKGFEKMRTTDESYDFILISTRTMKNFIDDYEDNGEHSPISFKDKFNIGLILADEAHNEFFNIYRTILYMNVKTLALSGTFTSSSHYVRNRMELLFNKKDRDNFIEDTNHIDFVAVKYKIPLREYELKLLDTISGYNDLKYESMIFGPKVDNRFKAIKDEDLPEGMLNIYNPEYRRIGLELVKDSVEEFIDIKQKNDKMLIYVSKVHTCFVIKEHLDNLYPDLNIEKYTQEDNYDIIEDADIIISTAKSSGEGFDIKTLRRVFTFSNYRSAIYNDQMPGRLRKRDVDVKYTFAYNENVKQQISFYKIRKQMYRNCNSFKDVVKV